jgi:tRNA C32,U32 (ribose-2'-O)-methylase TrmJ
MAALMARILDEFEDALSGHNGLSATSGDGRRIKRATTRYANNPQQAELTLTTVAKSLRR